ncbi:MAG TPA: hypothetical protein DIW64_15620, partial [Cellvibrio sp.]|nr:hypothetical protein [Cellvibrio sp.]
MVDTYFDITPYLSAIDNGELIITANNRLRNHMLRAYGQRQLDAARVWPSLRIYSLSQWIGLNWEVLQRRAYVPAAQRIINNLQRQTLWEKIIGESSLAAALLQPEPLAQAADSALRNLELWQLNEEQVRAAEPLVNIQSNTYCWLTWLGEFHMRLAQLGFITQETANQVLIAAFKNSELAQEAIIHLTGFDDIPPQHQDLINSACHKLHNIKLDNQQTQLIRTETQNSEAEIRAAA